jgi:hypothetical protein
MAITPREFGQVTREYLLPYTTMLAIMRDGDGDKDIIDSGSGMFLDTGTTRFLVTNAHVYRGYQKYRAEDAATTLNIYGGQERGFLDVTPATLLGIDEDCDLATLSIPPQAVQAIGKAYLRFAPWPPRRAAKGMLTIMVGYAGQGAANPDGRIPLRLIQSGGKVASVSDRQFVIHDESGGTIWLCPEHKGPISHFGGISGSPVYLVDTAMPAGSGRIFLGGIAMEALGNTTVLITHADHIRPDGSIE